MFLKDSLKLLQILQAQFNACSKYFEIQTEKTNALVVGDINKLDDIVRVEQSFVMQMESLESKKVRILEQAGLSSFTIRHIIANFVDDEFKEQFQEVLDKSVDVLNNIKKAAALNERLLKQRLLVVNNILSKTSKSTESQVIDNNYYNNSNPEFNKEIIKRA